MADAPKKWKLALKGLLIGFYLGGMGYSSRYIICYLQKNLSEEVSRG